jgi:hypothetical protein
MPDPERMTEKDRLNVLSDMLNSWRRSDAAFFFSLFDLDRPC